MYDVILYQNDDYAENKNHAVGLEMYYAIKLPS